MAVQITGTLGTVPDVLAALRGSLLVQCGTSQVNRSVRVTDRPGGGLVITAERHDLRGLLATARYLVEMTPYRRPILLDAARYAGDNRLPATAPFDPRWRRRQRELGLPVLTDSGYIGAGDDDGLSSVLRRTAEIEDAIALLPLHISWIRDPPMLRRLRTVLRSVGVPVAFVLESKRDPFAVPGVVDGVLDLVGHGPPAMLLRSDTSALGALCSGAVAAAIGTVGALRHLYPRSPGPPPRLGRTRPASAVFRPTLSYKWVSAIARAKRQHPDEPLWSCDCGTCEGRDVDWLTGLTEPEQEVFAFQHSMRVLLDLRDELIGGDPSIRDSMLSWCARCAVADSWIRQLGWPDNPALRRWREVIPQTPVALQPPRQVRRRLPTPGRS